MCEWVLYEENQKFFSFCAYGFGVYRHRLHIKYGGKKSTAEEIEGYLDTIVSYLTEKGCDVILFNAPPQDFKETNEGIRTALNEKIPAIAEKHGAKFFDFSALLSTEAEPEKAVYGGNPNGEGGTVVADAFVKQFGSLFE